MILFVECIIVSLLFGVGIVGSVLKNKTFWLQEYAPAVQERYLELYPEHKATNEKEKNITIIIKKVIVCIIFTVILTGLVYIAGARTFMDGFIKCYIIWFVVNWFDVFVLDIGILANWKKVRLPGTEDMDKEYQSNHRKSIIDGFFGMAIGLVVAAIVGILISFIY